MPASLRSLDAIDHGGPTSHPTSGSGGDEQTFESGLRPSPDHGLEVSGREQSGSMSESGDPRSADTGGGTAKARPWELPRRKGHHYDNLWGSELQNRQLAAIEQAKKDRGWLRTRAAYLDKSPTVDFRDVPVLWSEVSTADMVKIRRVINPNPPPPSSPLSPQVAERLDGRALEAALERLLASGRESQTARSAQAFSDHDPAQ